MLPGEMRKTLTLTVTTVLLAACGGAPVATTNGAASSSVAVVFAAGASLSCRLPVGGFIFLDSKGQVDNSMDVDGQPSQKEGRRWISFSCQAGQQSLGMPPGEWSSRTSSKT
jgi:hypothetical protein